MHISPYVVPLPAPPLQKKESSAAPGSVSPFAGLLKDALYKVNREQVQAAEAAGELVSGKMEDLHQLMIVSEQARLSLQLTVQLTGKLIEAYREISRMQV